MNLLELERLTFNTDNIFDIFGKESDNKLREYSIICHPDKYPDDPSQAERARRVFNELGRLHLLLNKPSANIKTPKRNYSLYNIIGVGDICDVYFAIGEDKPYVVKTQRIPNAVTFLDNERAVLTDLLGLVGKLNYSRYLPTYVESILLKDKFHKKVNIFVYESGFYTAEKIFNRYNEGLDSKHLAWLMNRLLTIAGVLQRSKTGWVHGSIIPSHILVDAANHGIKLAGWCHAVRIGQKANIISSKYKSWYPEEVIDKKPLGPQTDIYMIAKCIVYLAGGNIATGEMPDSIHPKFKAFIRSCLLPFKMRPDDAWKLLDELVILLKEIHGPRKFHKLAMP